MIGAVLWGLAGLLALLASTRNPVLLVPAVLCFIFAGLCYGTRHEEDLL